MLFVKSNWPISNGYRTNIILFISNKKSIRKHMSWTKLLHTHCDKEKIPSSNNPTLMKKWKWVLTLIYFTGFPRKRNYVLGWRNTNDSMILWHNQLIISNEKLFQVINFTIFFIVLSLVVFWKIRSNLIYDKTTTEVCVRRILLHLYTKKGLSFIWKTNISIERVGKGNLVVGWWQIISLCFSTKNMHS